MDTITINPKKHVRGIIVPPGDKSISHRSIILASLADGISSFTNLLHADDCLSTINAFKSMGVSIDKNDETVNIRGVGLNGLHKPNENVYLGNSGTTMRLLTGILSAQPFTTTLTGDNSLQSRPMNRIIEPLTLMGASITSVGNRKTAPLTIKGSALHGIDYMEKRGSAQVKSSILLAGLFAEGVTTVIECKPSRDHTERMLSYFGAPFEKSGNRLVIMKTESLQPKTFVIPGDISASAFFIVAALLLMDSDLTINNVGLNSTRLGFIDVLKEMGAQIDIFVKSECFEPTGTISVKSSRLHGITIDRSLIPFLIDELPILMVAAAFAQGETIIEGAEELRVKETDRIKSMSHGLNLLGAQTYEKDDGIIIHGRSKINGNVSVDSCNDHRTAMSLAIAALCCEHAVTISNTECVSTSYPQFFRTLNLLGN